MQRQSFRKILIANRGEIALRIIRTCRVMGIATVAVYSDADVKALHTLDADEAVYIGAAPAKESYLNIASIIEAAQRSGADAIHPGYGFLSENAEFAEACEAAGITFIGPSPQVIRKMGLKSIARKLMADAGVPVVPGYDGEDQGTLYEQMQKIEFPILIKASAGGGGKGMRIVRSEGEMTEAVEGARREAENAFGDGSLLLEKYIERARHIEIQIIGDTQGNLVHLFERDCSLQRRYQKIIEESPSPALNDELRQLMGETALKVGRTLSYTNAGTVEFILAPSGEFYFIEVNTRLQVEHPVTEMTTGLDLVKLQVEIAEGKPLRLSQKDLRVEGHAIEARLYAEDPSNDFLPVTGKIHDWNLPVATEALRIDCGVECGMEVDIYYDPMLAKLITHAEDRETAVRKLIHALRHSSIQGLQTNLDFLIRLLEHKDFREGNADTGFVADHLNELLGKDNERLNQASLVAVALHLQKKWQSANSFLAELPPGYRNNPYRDPSIKLEIDGGEVEVSWHQIADDRCQVKVSGSSFEAQMLSYGPAPPVEPEEPGDIRIAIDGVQRSFRIIETDDCLYVHSSLGSRVIKRLPRLPIRQVDSEQGSANSPMPGQVLKILVEIGQKISAGDPLIILEAMKMEHTMRAVVDGVVDAIYVTQGDVVAPGQVLVRIGAQTE